MKTCRKCGTEKPLGDFYRHASMLDGRLNFCIECVKARLRGYYALNRDRLRVYDKERSARPTRRAKAVEYQRNRRKRSPEKDRAHKLIDFAVRTGKIERLGCEVCGEVAEGHHPDYSRPLDVRWLCFIHHRMEHGQLQHVNNEVCT